MAFDFIGFFLEDLFFSEVGIEWDVFERKQKYKEFILFPTGEFIGCPLVKNIFIGR